MADTAEIVWRDFVTDGVPASGKHLPQKAKIREWGTDVENRLTVIQGSLSALGVGSSIDPLLGNNSANATTALQAAADVGGEIFIPDGVYLTDEITIDTQCHWRLAPGAVLKQRSHPDSHQRIFRFAPGSDGSSVRGGTFDGDRATHEPFYVEHGRTANYNTWEGIRSDDVHDLTIEGVMFQNFVTFGIRRSNGDRHTWRDLRVFNCGEGIYAYGGTGHVIDGVTMRDIQNNGTEIFQHGYELYALDSSFLRDINLINFRGDSDGLEPLVAGAVIVRCTNTHIDGLSFRGYEGDLRNIGVLFNSMEQCTVNGLHTVGYEAGYIIESSTDFVVDGFVVDGNYANVSGTEMNGVWACLGGTFDPNEASLAGETTANLTSRNVTVSNGIVMRMSGRGLKNQSSDIHFHNVRVLGCGGDAGIHQSEFTSASNPWPDAFRRNIYNARYTQCSVVACAGAGAIFTAGDRLTIDGCEFLNNGQNSGATYRNGIHLLADSSELSDVRITNYRCEDTQGFSITDGVTYLPGTYATQFWVTFANPDLYEIGQKVTLVAAGSGSTNVTGTIVEREADDCLIYVGSSTTLIDNLQTVGTGSSSGTALTLTGGGFSFAIHFPVYLKHPSNGEYRRIAFITDSTHAVLASAFSTPIPGGSTLQIVIGDVNGIPSQQYGVSANANVVGPVFLKGGDVKTNVVGDYDLSAMPASVYAPGSELNGNIYLDGGSAASPSYSRINDANTGMYFPGADQLGFATGGVNRIFVHTNGDTGIGTTTPQRRLHAAIEESGTNDVVFNSRFSRWSTNTVAAGFGTGLEIGLENASGADVVAANVSATWSDPVAGTEDSILKWAVRTAGTLADELGLHGTALYPIQNNGLDLGGGANRFNTLFCTNIDLNNSLLPAVGRTTIASGSLSGSSVEFKDLPQGYSCLQLQIINASHNDGSNQALRIQLSTDAGSSPTYDTSSGNYVGFTIADTGAVAYIGVASLINTSVVGAGGAAANHQAGITIHGYNSAGHTNIIGRLSNGSNNFAVQSTYLSGLTVKAIKVFFSAGSFDGGTYILTGIS